MWEIGWIMVKISNSKILECPTFGNWEFTNVQIY